METEKLSIPPYPLQGQNILVTGATGGIGQALVTRIIELGGHPIIHFAHSAETARDLVARIGGEEFLIIMPNTSHAQAQRTATRLCSVIANHPFRLATHLAPQHLTMSIGVAVQEASRLLCESPAAADGLADSLLERADAALYRSKRHGRTQVTMSERSAA